MALIKYWEKTLTHQHLINEEIKITLNSDNVCYHSFQNPCPLVCCLET
jgi:hypothetical protein